ncbi:MULTISPECIES: hypothetical protein [Prochlorococcus]|nr:MULTISPECIES: hypothetical protein [Prochlorococcus]KGG13407.1 hypothetical protein EV04_0642 [Prochlorococcus marinus str. LG]KGG21349.1 hypothetical protein EV08_0757 [Prochlorococcus marinus str. SS2]KGG24319.1 hypothetical protein EV09_0366 [Prochlorococcus marinus str. SS35]KGG33603.1 hypothetical protein EV10_0443 [Prochlorococcus marinus str. SS51]KGG36481.1 hypothetical protein EV11_0853 [Prochlorococcus sp. SS52]
MKKRFSIVGIFIVVAFTHGMLIFHENFPSAQTRQKISVDGMFLD